MLNSAHLHTWAPADPLVRGSPVSHTAPGVPMAPGDCRSSCWGKTAHRRPPEGWQTDTLTPYWGEPHPRMESVVDTAVPGRLTRATTCLLVSGVSTQDSGDYFAVCPPKLRKGYLCGPRLLATACGRRISKHIGAGQKLVDEVVMQLRTQELTFVTEVSTIQHGCASNHCAATFSSSGATS